MAQDDQDDMAAQWAAQLDGSGGADDLLADVDLSGDASASAGGEDESLASEWAESLANDEKNGGTDRLTSFAEQATDAQFKDMTEAARQPHDQKLKRELDFILDIPLDVSAELGRTRLLINELLQLGQGSVVELNKLAGEPLEVFVNGKLVARGEAVVINEKFGVRLTDIISPIERVKQLG
ncbi:flagellar motor switch protein FliN [uncultured Desulfovibrio sp.]|uniref:flagellar motor switch protein FliN n=1 Tax=uncultured Desulfovibrio sp. TaxID=167968 RepID=UPI002630A486|nr:flagellar motor switch protein FliN [uncultured Desulfovibrio sp.]